MFGLFGLNLGSHGCDHALMLVAIVAYQSKRVRGDLDRLRGWPLAIAVGLDLLLVHGIYHDMHHFEMTCPWHWWVA